MLGNMLRQARRKRARTAVFAIVASLTLGLTATGALGEATVQVECEAFVDYHDIGGLRIHKEFCSGASEFYSADGVDVVGEWIEMIIFAPVTGYYEPTVGYQIEYEETAGVRMTVIDEDGEGVNRETIFQMDEGWGFG